MAAQGEGPLADRSRARVCLSKADQAARDIQRASSELWALYEVAQTLSSSLGLDETLDILARKLEAIFAGERVSSFCARARHGFAARSHGRRCKSCEFFEDPFADGGGVGHYRC